MNTLSFENLDFSFLIEVDRNTAYLQEWEDGAWGEPEQYSLPVALDQLPKKSRLARAMRSFRNDSDLRESLERGLIRQPAAPRNTWSRIVDFCAAAILGGEPASLPASVRE